MEAAEFVSIIMNSLVGVYLWLFFGYLSMYINCDLQRILRDNVYVLHLFGFFTFFFLFTKYHGAADQHPGLLFAQTAVVYVMWVLASKMKWYFIFVVLALLLLHQIVLLFVDHYMAGEERHAEKEELRRGLTTGLYYAIVGTIVLGVVDYMRLQRIEYRGEFSFWKFFVARGRCKHRFPDYAAMRADGQRREGRRR